MVAQEASVHKGGILADEMGMGKTIQTVSCLLAGKASHLQAVAKAAAAGEAPPAPPRPTLIVCPSSCVMQWMDEIHRACAPGEGALSVLVYYQVRDPLPSTH
jgi:DNA repair protein RAD16